MHAQPQALHNYIRHGQVPTHLYGYKNVYNAKL